IDTFALNHLGLGRSSGLNVMNNACNASLPEHDAGAGQTCPAGSGALYDCLPVGPDTADQQGSTRFLNSNPLASRCAHTSQYRFPNQTTLVQDLDAAVNDALSKTGLSKVNLLSHSAGGIDVGNYLGSADASFPGTYTSRQAKIERAILIASPLGSD